jgi:polysaccharide biosynthesis/export protein
MLRLLLAFLVISGGSAVHAGQLDAPKEPVPALSADSGYTSEKIGPDDLLALSVADLPELTRNFRVSADGTLSLPLLKEKIQAGGKTTQDIEQQISDALVREQILVSPVVSVVVSEYKSMPVSVLGAVRHPTTFQAAGDVRLLDALTRADGLTPEAGADILVSRPSKEGDPAVVQRIPIKELIDNANPALNVRLRGGEEIRVPLAGRVFVLGNVKKSGAFPIEDNGDLTVLKILAESEGLLPFTSKQAYIYRKEGGAAGRSEIPIPLRQIMDRKSPDISLQTNDILYIPDDKHKRVTVGALERAAGFGLATASGFLVFH